MNPRRPGNSGKDRATTEEVKRFFLTDDYVNHALGPGSRATTGVRLDEQRVRARGKHKADQAEQKAAEVETTMVAKNNLRDKFNQDLKECCDRHNYNYKETLHLFIACKGRASVHWTVQREYYHRSEFNSKRVSHRNVPPKLAASDPLLDTLCLGFNKPVHEFVCDPAIAWARPDCRMGASKYTTGGSVQLVFGRVAKTPEEKEQVNFQGRVAAELALPPPAPLDPRPWTPIDRQKMEKLLPAVQSFERCMTLELGELRAARDANNTLRRTYLQSEGQAHTRPPDNSRLEKPRLEKRVRTSSEMPYQKLSERIIITAESVVSEEDNLHSDQFKALAHMWHLLGIMASDGKYGASMDCLYHLIDELQRSEALVFNCDFQYERPNGRRFRTVSETVSFMRDELKDLVSLGLEETGKCQYIAESAMHVRVYALGRKEVTLYPYAAVLHSSTGCVDLSIPVLRKYHPEQYEVFTTVLQNWHQALMSQNGGIEAALRRTSIQDDEAYGPGQRVVMLERPPRNQAHPRGHWPTETRWRVRRLRFAESDSEGGSLPDTGYPLCMELDIGNGWMLWAQQRFYMQQKQTPGAPWFLMPIDSQGCLRHVGWLEGDDLAPEMHDYAYLNMQEGMLSDLMPLLERMFV